MKKALLLLLLLLIPNVSADCSIKDIGDCLTENLYDFMQDIINAPIKPLVSAFESLLSWNIDLSSFATLWSIIVYVLSFFYIFSFLFAAVQFLTSSNDAHRRTQAKESLKNALLMLVLVQSSYWLYSLLIEASSALTQGMLNLLSDRFFLPVELSRSFGSNLLYTSLYVAALCVTVIFLLIRFFLVAIGMILFPIGIFLYFIQPLREYGKSIIYFFSTLIFVPFFLTIVFLVGDKLISSTLLGEFKPLVLIAMLVIVNLTMLYVTIGALLKAFMSSTSLIRKTASTVRAVKYFL